MSYINVLEDIAEKYNMEKFDKEWIKVIVDDYIKLAENFEKLEIAFNRTWEGLNNIYESMKGEQK